MIHLEVIFLTYTNRRQYSTDSIRVHEIFFTLVGQYYIRQNFGRGGGQFFRGNFRILLHFYYQFFSENLGGGLFTLVGPLSEGEVRPSIPGGRPATHPPHAHA